MKWIRETELDILCIQEHNAGADKLKEWKRIAHANGLCIRLGTRRETTARGGAALIAKMSTFNLGEKDSGRQRELEGGIATLRCDWRNQKFQFVSLYVPSQEQDRKLYLTRLKRSGVITKNSIVLGDFNCVENTMLDVKYSQDRENNNYTNTVSYTHLRAHET